MTSTPPHSGIPLRPAPSPFGGPLGEGVDGQREGSLLKGLVQILGSQAALAGVGVLCLPITARNLGLAGYGNFTLFLLSLGVLSSFDIARPLLIRAYSKARGQAARAASTPLLRLNGILVGVGALILGRWLLDPVGCAGLVLAILLHAGASGRYGELAARQRAASALSIRNTSWALATLAIVPASFFTQTSHAFVWGFALANGATWILYRRMADALRAEDPVGESNPDRGEDQLRFATLANLMLFNLSSALVVGTDKALLRSHADDGMFSSYGAQYDLAVKVNMISTALSNLLFPMLSRAVAERGEAEASRIFVRFASRTALGYFAVLLVAVVLKEPIVRGVLGADFAHMAPLYGVTLVGVFLHLFGFLLTAQQRARGDFATQRRCYLVAAGLMVVVGLILIPRFGAAGALATYLTARTGELLMIAHEVRRLPADILPRRRVVALFSMLACLGLCAAWKGPLGG